MPTENRSSNTEMVSVPRETIEQAEKLLQEDNRCTMAREFRIILAQPAEQHHGEPVLLPERMAESVGFYPTGWNACLDEIAKLGPLYTHADPGEAERLRGIIRMHEKTVREQTDHLAYMRAQLAERDALLHSLDCAWNSHDGKERFVKLMRKVETLAASAEPCAAVEVDHDALVAAVCVLRSQGLGNLSAAVEEARTALERKPS